MRLDEVLNIEDLHRQAARRVPRVAFDYYEGGVEDEHGLLRNEQAFRRHRLLPRFLVDVSRVDQSAPLFGRTYASPFGIGPTALAGVLRYGADLMLAQAAAAADIPYVMSNLSNTTLEAAAAAAPRHAWFQLYGAKDRKISEDLLRRADAAGINGVVFTVDVPVVSRRERELRNGFGRPRMPLRAYVEALRHPGWLAEYLRHGVPLIENWVPYAPKGASAREVVGYAQTQFPVPDHSWRDVENFRRLWPRPLLLKGILHPDDAVRAAELGVDGVIVSNHGARQLDSAPTALDMLPAIRAAVGDRLTLIVDGGVRRGADILIALALGAQFVFVGRATAYGAAAFGLPGARRAIEILRQEVEINLKQIGCTSLSQLGPHSLLRGD
jgi:L-lactate dehydrogenase (cytochrome)/(S)-mandelate dehydrogenase